MKVQIDLPQDVYQKLKEEAATHFQSLRGHIAYRLINQVRGTNTIDLSSLPEGTTIKTKTTHTLTPEEERTNRYNRFQTLAKQILGHIVTEIEDYRIMDYNSNSLYYSKEVEEPIREGSSVKCVYIYNLPEEKQIEYLEELKHYEEKDRGLTRLQSFSNY